MNSNCLAGIFPILATTFTDDGALDLESQASLVEYLLRQGVHGLGLFGNASEGYALTESERRQLLRLIVKQVNGRVPLVVSTGHTGTDAAIGASCEAEAEGASALMVLPPYYVKTGSDGLIHYYQSISSRVSIPIMIQDAPLMSQVSMPAALLARMEREIENVCYVKVEAAPTAPKTTEVLRASEGRLIVFGGLNCQFLYEELERGAKGAMPNSDIAGVYVRIWDYFRAGDTREAWRLFVPGSPARLEGEGEYRWAAAYPCLYSTLIETALIRVRLDNGIEGWGEAQAPLAPEVACTIVEHILRPAIAGEEFLASPRAIARLWDRMYSTMRVRGQTGGFMLDAISGVDLALWDAAGKCVNGTVSAMLESTRRCVSAYLSGIPGDRWAEAASLRQSGVNAAKGIEKAKQVAEESARRLLHGAAVTWQE